MTSSDYMNRAIRGELDDGDGELPKRDDPPGSPRLPGPANEPPSPIAPTFGDRMNEALREARHRKNDSR